MNTITINFGNIISELEENNLKLCFLKDRGLFIEDSRNSLYQMELYRAGSYLDKLIANRVEVCFNYIDDSISQNIGDYEKEIWGVSEVESFIERQHLKTL